MDHETIQDIGDEGSSSGPRIHSQDIEDFLARFTSNNESHDKPQLLALIFSQPLSLDLLVAFLALGIADTADNLAPLRKTSEECMAISKASDMFNQSRGLMNVASLTAVSERRVCGFYKAI